MTPAHLILTATICRERAEAYREAAAQPAQTWAERADRVIWSMKADAVEFVRGELVRELFDMQEHFPAFLVT